MEANGKEQTFENDDGVLEVDGVVFPTAFAKNEADILKRFSYVKHLSYRAGDVLLCSYPKTGSHWVTNILHYLMYNGHLNDMVSIPTCYIDFFDTEEEVQRDGKRILLSHFPPKRLPIEHFANGGKTILLFRNPKDTVVSMFYMLLKQRVFGELKSSWDTFLKQWLNGKIPIGSYFEYYNWWSKELSEKPNLDILIVQYEDLKTNSLNEVRRIQKYLGLNHSDERLVAVLNRCSLENLKADVDNGKATSRLLDMKGKSAVYRKGIIGDWKNMFTVSQSEMFDAIVNEKMKNNMFNR